MQSMYLTEILSNRRQWSNMSKRLGVCKIVTQQKWDDRLAKAAHGKQQKVCSKTPMGMLMDIAYLYIGL